MDSFHCFRTLEGGITRYSTLPHSNKSCAIDTLNTHQRSTKCNFDQNKPVALSLDCWASHTARTKRPLMSELCSARLGLGPALCRRKGRPPRVAVRHEQLVARADAARGKERHPRGPPVGAGGTHVDLRIGGSEGGRVDDIFRKRRGIACKIRQTSGKRTLICEHARRMCIECALLRGRADRWRTRAHRARRWRRRCDRRAVAPRTV